jgi:hypothetical protein
MHKQRSPEFLKNLIPNRNSRLNTVKVVNLQVTNKAKVGSLS